MTKLQKLIKHIFAQIKLFFYAILHYKTYRKFKSYERLLKKGLLDREKEKIKLLYQASALIPKKVKRGKSNFIPLDIPTNAEIKAIILFEFGYKMKALGMRITDDLKFI